MNRKSLWLLALIFLLVVTFTITCRVFETTFAEVTIDWFSFLAGIFLMTEGCWKIIVSREKFFPNQFLRGLRAIIGTCVFTIHLLQFMRV